MPKNLSPGRKRIPKQTTTLAALRVGEPLTRAKDDALLTVPEAARILKVSRSLIYQMIHTGELPSIAIRSIVRIRRRDLDQLIRIGSWDHARVQPPGISAEAPPEGRMARWRRQHGRD